MSELDDLEEIDLGAHGSTSPGKRRLNGIKQSLKYAGQHRGWRSALRRYQTQKANKANKSEK